MAASPQIVSTQPEYLNARTGIYTAQDLRKPKDDVIAPGAQDMGSFRVFQRAAGANMSVDVGVVGIFNKFYIRGQSVTDQGIYRIESTGVLNLDIAAADPTNPRVDQIYLCIEDQQHAGANNQATVRVVTGTATGGATLDNRTGVGAQPALMSSELLADVLVPAASVTVPTGNIRDRRRFGNMGGMPHGGAGSALDMVAFEPHFGQVVNGRRGDNTIGTTIIQPTYDNFQAAALCWLPRRIAATRIRWSYIQGGTAVATNYCFWVSDASGRNLAQTAATAFTGAANVAVPASVAFGPITLEAGWYYVGFGVAAMTAASSVTYANIWTTVGTGRAAPYPNLVFRSAAGGSGAPQTILGFGDVVSVAGTQDNVAVPLCALSTT